MNLLVDLFFLHNVLATLLLGAKFISRKDSVLKNFGTALILNGIAFAIWSYAIITQTEMLADYVTYGVAFFLAALIFLLNTSTQSLKSDMRVKFLSVGIAASLLLFYLRTYIYPTNPTISAEGFFFFNIHPLIQMIYIFGLLITSLPAINSVSAKFKGMYAPLIWFCFLIEVIGGIILMTTTDTQVLYLTGLVMGGAYLALWVPLLSNNKAWTTK